jgi:hypothetical protein
MDGASDDTMRVFISRNPRNKKVEGEGGLNPYYIICSDKYFEWNQPSLQHEIGGGGDIAS